MCYLVKQGFDLHVAADPRRELEVLMKVLLVTGQSAERVLSESAAQQKKVQFLVKALPVPIAAMLTPNQIAEELKHEDLSGFDLVIVPGMVRGDISKIEQVVKVPVVKGTRYASDALPMLEVLESVKLSKTQPADSILSEHLRSRNAVILEDGERQDRQATERPWNVVIGKGVTKTLPVGRDFPMRVMAEILDAPTLGDEEILRKAKHYVESGARIIDVGMLAGDARPDDARRAVSLLKHKLAVPISIDTLNPEEIETALLSGVDMVLSLNSQNIDKINYPADSRGATVVVIAERGRTAEEKVASLEENTRSATEVGFKKIIADPVMDPPIFPGIVTSIVASRLFSDKNPDVPLMAGVGNITELIDADSIGVNAIMAGIGQELGMSLLLTTEGSTKTEGAVKELATACDMMYLAKRRKTPPKDLGVSLLKLKEKRRREIPYNATIEARRKGLRILNAKKGLEPEVDPKGFFKVNVDRDDNKIVVSHFHEGRDEADTIVKGSEPMAIRDTLNTLDLVSSLEHAYYLGVEVQKACTASRINRSYYQDEELFERDSHEDNSRKTKK
jgi:dihydropteroate synthase-like protein